MEESLAMLRARKGSIRSFETRREVGGRLERETTDCARIATARRMPRASRLDARGGRYNSGSGLDKNRARAGLLYAAAIETREASATSGTGQPRRAAQALTGGRELPTLDALSYSPVNP